MPVLHILAVLTLTGSTITLLAYAIVHLAIKPIIKRRSDADEMAQAMRTFHRYHSGGKYRA